jgi:DDE superfamily endonuclease
LLFPPLRAGWALRGQPLEVLLCGRNARRVIFGALNLRTGHRLWLTREHRWAEDFQAFLRQLYWHYRGWHVTLLLDEDSSHTARRSPELAGVLGMELLWLPKRCPKLNPLDHLWGDAKDEICANRQYASIEVQAERLINYLSHLSPCEALHRAGVLSKTFWLKSVL